MKRSFSLCLALIVTVAVLPLAAQTPLYKTRNSPVEARVNDLLKRMTLDEKIMQLNQYTLGENKNANNIERQVLAVNANVGSLIFMDSNPVMRNAIQKKAIEGTRLGIPILFGYDVIHGYKTLYPIPLAIACSWNVEQSGKACEVAAREARASGVEWTFSPMIDIGRDPRWGRVAEGYGEDPYTNAIFGASAVRAYQGKDLSLPTSIAACLKHYVGYGVSEGGRDYRYSDVSPQALWETYLLPYKAGVDAGAATLMSAFNDISGVPATANHYTLTEILKDRWKHDGFVVSDWDAVNQLIAQGVAKDRKEAALKALMAGVEMDMRDNIYQEHLKQLVLEKKVPLSRIDDAVKRVLRIKFRLGLFDEPYTRIIPEKDRYLSAESKAIVSLLAEESMVLLKNNASILPVKTQVKTIAVIGPLAKDSTHIMGSWTAHGDASNTVSIYNGLQKEFNGRADLLYAKGCEFDGTDTTGFNAALLAAQRSDMVVICIGEKRHWSGENASRSTIALPQVQERLVAALKRSGKPIVLVLVNGRPLELARLEPLADAILEAWQPGTMGGHAVAGILSGRVNPSGKLAITFPLTTGQIPTYYNMRRSARPFAKMGDYQDISTEPLYWFGHGLSYTSFSYGDIKLSASKIKKGQLLTAEVEVANNGALTGKETALWYISDLAASISRPIKELKYFEKKEIKAGERTVYKFVIDPEKDLSFPDHTGKTILEAGDYHIAVGGKHIKFELVD